MPTAGEDRGSGSPGRFWRKSSWASKAAEDRAGVGSPSWAQGTWKCSLQRLCGRMGTRAGELTWSFCSS